MALNLHTIFRHLVGDDKFLSTIIEVQSTPEIKATRKKSISSIIMDYQPLQPGESQKLIQLPPNFKSILIPGFVRRGIRYQLKMHGPITDTGNVADGLTNHSFLVALNLLLRPELFTVSHEELTRTCLDLGKYLTHLISRNFRIDRSKDIKNTKKVQASNKSIIDNMNIGLITPQLLQLVANIFGANILILKPNEDEIAFYWSRGDKYPSLNVFGPLWLMTCTQDVFEPVIYQGNLAAMQLSKIYTQILLNDNIKNHYPLALGIHFLPILFSWPISIDTVLSIIKKYYPRPSLKDRVKQLKQLQTIGTTG